MLKDFEGTFRTRFGGSDVSSLYNFHTKFRILSKKNIVK